MLRTRGGPYAVLVAVLTFAAVPSAPGPAKAQSTGVLGIPTLAGEAEDRLRTRQLQGMEETDGFLFRTPSIILDRYLDDEGTWSVYLMAPEFKSVSNSDLPFSLNDGPLWAGVGWNGSAMAGIRAKLGPLTLMLAPQLMRESNEPFQYFLYPWSAEPPRSLFANPYYPPPQSMDYPVRFGDEPRTRVDPGQSSLTLSLGPVGVGVSTESAWWGPGIRNSILMSSQGPGIPRLFVRTREPLRTRAGNLELLWILGRLEESDFFDEDPGNDHRSLSGFALAFQPAFDTGLTFGIGRTVFAPLPEGSSPFGAAFDAFGSVGRPNRLERETSPSPGPDQILALFARWVFPPWGAELYGEWARFEEAGSIRDFLEFPQHSQGYTVGFQWMKWPGEWAHVRVQAEISNLEPAGTWRFREPFSSYASRVVPQGYTHRGQVVGASIGPGASSQWVAVDYLFPEGTIGAFGGRIRWNGGAWLTEAVGQWAREDVTVFWGVRGGVDFMGWNLSGELSTGMRINYLFQTFPAEFPSGRAEGVDIANTHFSLTLSKSLWRPIRD